MPESHWSNGLPNEDMYPARDWSHRFGQILHDHLNAPNTPIDTAESALEGYAEWVNIDFPKLQERLMIQGESQEIRAKAQNELNFHNLNRTMADMWNPVVSGGWKEISTTERESIINELQDLLALTALHFYARREKASIAYFDQSTALSRASFEGVVNEYDAAVVLLEVVKKRPDLTVVPAPLQFEHGDKSLNADFVVISQEGKAVGVQVKSSVKNGDVVNYDPKRIVLVDGRIDFGNELARRTNPRQSDREIVTWAGLICMSRVAYSIKPYGPRSKELQQSLTGTHLAGMKMRAKSLLGGVRPNFHEATHVVSERVLRHL